MLNQINHKERLTKDNIGPCGESCLNKKNWGLANVDKKSRTFFQAPFILYKVKYFI